MEDNMTTVGGGGGVKLNSGTNHKNLSVLISFWFISILGGEKR